jgi:HEPN domain-containing protein
MQKDTTGWKIRFEQEMKQAESARRAGNEGKARVCARRAAGVVIQQYLASNSIPVTRSSAYALLHIIANTPDLSAETREVARHFLLRITPEQTLPIEADLIAEARWLAQELLSEEL